MPKPKAKCSKPERPSRKRYEKYTPPKFECKFPQHSYDCGELVDGGRVKTTVGGLSIGIKGTIHSTTKNTFCIKWDNGGTSTDIAWGTKICVVKLKPKAAT